MSFFLFAAGYRLLAVQPVQAQGSAGQEVAMLTGTVRDGETIPLPDIKSRDIIQGSGSSESSLRKGNSLVLDAETSGGTLAMTPANVALRIHQPWSRPSPWIAVQASGAANAMVSDTR